MDEMRVQAFDPCGHFGRQHHALAEAPRAVGSPVAREIMEETRAGGLVARQLARLPPRADHAQRVVLHILRQVDDRRLDARMHGMDRGIGRQAQRVNHELQPTRLEPRHLLGDEGFGKARPTLNHDRNLRVFRLNHETP